LFERKDITNQPMGEHEGWISFWHDNKIMVYPSCYERWISFWHDNKIRVYPSCDVEYYEFVPQNG
jgi:hypothetical protein